MTGQLDVSREEHLGIIALNRPEAINALSAEMIHGIIRTLEQWRDDDGIKLVLFEGRGSRGFCAGGDVRAVRQMVLGGRAEEADAFFAAEYYMNGLIATFPKPTVALTHGIVMGGGIGIAGHCRYRVSLGESKWAMPEAAIGFVSDVGVNAILAKVPIDNALDFLMSGAPVGVAGAVALGLLDAMIAVDDREAFLSDVATAAKAKDVDAAMVHVIQRRPHYGSVRVSGETPSDSLHAFGIDWTDFETAATTVSALHREQVKRNSPTSLYAIHQSHLAARRVATVREVLAVDLALAQLLCRKPDFAEGVRAVLVDKDQRPNWQPRDLAEVDAEAIRAAIAAAIGPKLV